MEPRVLSLEDLAAIKERARKASPGPWAWMLTLGGEPWDGEEADLLDFEALRAPGESILFGLGCTDYSGLICLSCAADAHFIAHAREDIPNLLRTLEAMQEQSRGKAAIPAEAQAAAPQAKGKER